MSADVAAAPLAPAELMGEIDSDPEPQSEVPSNTPVNGGSGHASPQLQGSSENLNEDGLKKESSPEVDSPSTESSAAAEALKVAEANKRLALKEAKKEEKRKAKKKEDKSVEYILRALNSLQSPEEKLAALCKKYADLHEEHRVLQASFKTQQRTMTVVMREKDQLQSEHTKAVMGRSKLESLCRELQKQNKLIKDESIKRAREEDERRKEISSQFQTTIGEIQAQMNDNTERNTKLRAENAELAVQLQNIIKQCEAREAQVDKVRKQHDLEQQLAAAKLSKADLQLREEQERNKREKDLLISKFTEQAKKNSMLEAQVTMFKERYDDFEKLSSRSSETFQKYKTEMDKMTKRIKKLEKDGMQWKQKWEASNKGLIEMMEARNKSEKETLQYVQRCKKLESLCRALQAQGKTLPPEEPPAPAPADPVDPAPQASPAPDTPTPAPEPSTEQPEAEQSSSSMDDIAPPAAATPAAPAPPNSPQAPESESDPPTADTQPPEPANSSPSPASPSSALQVPETTKASPTPDAPPTQDATPTPETAEKESDPAAECDQQAQS